MSNWTQTAEETFLWKVAATCAVAKANDEPTEMSCKICCSHPHLADGTGVFYTSSKCFSHPLFDQHERSEEHTHVAQAVANKQASQAENQ